MRKYLFKAHNFYEIISQNKYISMCIYFQVNIMIEVTIGEQSVIIKILFAVCRRNERQWPSKQCQLQ